MTSSATQCRSNAMGRADGAARRVDIAFVNNMPDAAIRSAEQQFRRLLEAGAHRVEVTFRGFYFPGVPRTGPAQETFLQLYRDIDELWDSQVDGLIVTGAEPHAECIEDEPYWPMLSKLTDWAADNTVSTIWSCLAAHAAAFRMAGVTRVRLPKKLSGLFMSTTALDHPLTADLPKTWLNPQSRYNDLPQDKLSAAGFQPLTRLEGGFDTFINDRRSLFVFFQGHPEYDAQSLLLEFIRDLKRYMEGQSETIPEPPAGYFDQEKLSNIEELCQFILTKRDAKSFQQLSRIVLGHQIMNTWRCPSVTLYKNWLSYIARKKFEGEANNRLTPVFVENNL